MEDIKTLGKSILPSASQLFGEAWEVYSKNFGFFLAISLISAAISSLAHVLNQNFLSTNFTWLVWGLTLALSVMGLCIIAWSATALIFGIKSLYSGDKISILSAYNQGADRWGRFMGTAFLVGIISTTGFILLIIPGIIFSVWLSFAVYMTVLEGSGISDSLKNSRNYAEKYFWPILWRWMVWFIALIGLSLISGLIFGLFGASFSLSQDTTTFIAGLVTDIIWIPFSFIYGYSIYTRIKNS